MFVYFWMTDILRGWQSSALREVIVNENVTALRIIGKEVMAGPTFIPGRQSLISGDFSPGTKCIFAFYGLTLLIMLSVVLLTLFMILKILYNSLTVWKKQKSVSLSEESFVVSQLLLTVLHCTCLVIAITWKVWPKFVGDPDCCDTGYCVRQEDTATDNTTVEHQTLKFPRHLHEVWALVWYQKNNCWSCCWNMGIEKMSLEASLAALFLVPVVYPLGALFPRKGGALFYMAFSQSKLLCILFIWMPWIWIFILFALPDLANWTLLFLLPLLTMHNIPMIIFFIEFHRSRPTAVANYVFRLFCPKEGPINSDFWHYRRWISNLVHYTWSVIGYLPAVLLTLLLPNCPHPAVAILGMMLPTVLYGVFSALSCTLVFCTRLVHHCDQCVRDEQFRMPYLPSQCNWCREHKGYLYRKVYKWPTPFGKRMLYGYALGSDGHHLAVDILLTTSTREALLSGV